MGIIPNNILQDITRQIGTAETKDTHTHDRIVTAIYNNATNIAKAVVKRQSLGTHWDQKIDDVITSRWLGFPIMFLFLGTVLWLTITGANYPSQVLAAGLFWIEERLAELFLAAGVPLWLKGLFVDGMYRALAWVVSVMLPPMAIFFPIFTFFEDLGYLPRIAFNLDRLFHKAGAHGKQALTMAMGFGCNAAGIIATRIIESPRERLIAILTNVFVPCNGRFPTLIVLAGVALGGLATTSYSSLIASAVVAGIVVAGVVITLLTSWLLSKTLLRGIPSLFTLELPPYRKPLIGQILVRSFLDRTVFVLVRAVTIAAPAGLGVWILANTSIAGQSIINILVGWLDPFAALMGLDGFILLAFILGLPANEIVLPILIMGYVSAGSMVELNGLEALKHLLVVEHDWTWLTALCTMLFSLLHFPCGTTLYTIHKEQKSWKWTVLAAVIPFGMACTVCFLVAQGARVFGLV
ncbi:MAG: ferrous iron transporter B [Peptococcaceae bacterium]|nr:ferrous iron transporter B [Peptococcaceae bacterium]